MMIRITKLKRSVATAVAVVVVAGLIISFKAEKKYSVNLSLEQWNSILTVMDESNANHSQVKTSSNWIVSQIQTQLKDSTK